MNPNYFPHQPKGGQLYMVVALFEWSVSNGKDETLAKFHFTSNSLSSSTCLIPQFCCSKCHVSLVICCCSFNVLGPQQCIFHILHPQKKLEEKETKIEGTLQYYSSFSQIKKLQEFLVTFLHHWTLGVSVCIYFIFSV